MGSLESYLVKLVYALARAAIDAYWDKLEEVHVASSDGADVVRDAILRSRAESRSSSVRSRETGGHRQGDESGSGDFSGHEDG